MAEIHLQSLSHMSFVQQGTHTHPRVAYGSRRVSDLMTRQALERISQLLHRELVVTSGDRSQVLNANRRSHHLLGRAADFYVRDMSLGEAYQRILGSGLFSNDFQIIYHTEETSSPHIHLGRYGDYRRSVFMIDRGSILPKK